VKLSTRQALRISGPNKATGKHESTTMMLKEKRNTAARMWKRNLSMNPVIQFSSLFRKCCCGPMQKLQMANQRSLPSHTFYPSCGLCSSRLRLSLDRDWIRYHSLSTLAVLQPQVYWQCPSSFCYFDWSEFVQRGIVGIPASWTFPNGKGHQLSLAFQASLRALHRSLISYVPGRAPKFRSLAIFSP